MQCSFSSLLRMSVNHYLCCFPLLKKRRCPPRHFMVSSLIRFLVSTLCMYPLLEMFCGIVRQPEVYLGFKVANITKVFSLQFKSYILYPWGIKFIGGSSKPLENFSQQKHGHLSRNLEFIGFWVISMLRRAPRRQGVIHGYPSDLLGAL